jgi:hypothetical protein
MTNRRRTSREVYRVYSEDAYLAGADELGEWHASHVAGVPRDGRLRRLGGAAALTGAVGAVGGVLVFAGVGARVPGRRVAVIRAPAARAGLLRSARAALRASAVRRLDMGRAATVRRAGLLASRAPVARVAVRRPSAWANAARPAWPRRVAESEPGAPSKAIERTPSAAYNAAEGTPVEAVPGSHTQSEFGFER